jgi:hypothetical protein
MSLAKDAVAVISHIKEENSKGRRLELFVYGGNQHPLAVEVMVKVSRRCLKSVGILFHYLSMKLELKVVTMEHHDFDGLDHWLFELVNIVNSLPFIA